MAPLHLGLLLDHLTLTVLLLFKVLPEWGLLHHPRLFLLLLLLLGTILKEVSRISQSTLLTPLLLNQQDMIRMVIRYGMVWYDGMGDMVTLSLFLLEAMTCMNVLYFSSLLSL
jgi:hypothetical protein